MANIVYFCAQEHSKETLDSWQIVRVSEDFRIFALGLPVPKYRGHPLDPPLRSRFQARDIYHISFSVRVVVWADFHRNQYQLAINTLYSFFRVNWHAFIVRNLGPFLDQIF